jgi:hypothetical protein
MYLVKTIDQFNDKNIFFCDPIKNNVMNDGIFIRIIYSSEIVAINGIFLLLTLNDVTCEKYYSKYRCKFNTTTHAHIINDLKSIEENILKKYSVPNKMPQFKIYDQIKNGYIKVFFDIEKKPETLFTLKISGIWETEENYGLTYKFSKIN